MSDAKSGLIQEMRTFLNIMHTVFDMQVWEMLPILVELINGEYGDGQWEFKITAQRK